MNEWTTFFAAIVGASATLTGLIFVGVSISLKQILSLPALPRRALEALLLLLSILFEALFCLIPHQSPLFIGAELALTGTVTWVITLVLDWNMVRFTEPEYKKHHRMNIIATQVAVLPIIIAGIITINIGFAGIYWLVPGIIFSFLKAVIDAWVLLIEIHR